MDTKAKRIDLDKGVFTANGKTYYIEGELSIERYCEYQILEKELGFGVTMKSMFESLNMLWTHLNKMEFAEASVKVNNMIRGFAKMEEREPTILKICALYMNEENEDRSTINESMITDKIRNWKEEGLEMKDFFSVALGSVHGITDVYRKVARIISGEEKPGALSTKND